MQRDAHVVPTHVGVNRMRDSHGDAPTSCPHTRGGEPAMHADATRSARESVPTHVGVNRSDAVARGQAMQLSPRTWG